MSDLATNSSLPDLTSYISREGNQYFAGGALGDVYRCRYTNGSELREVAVKALRFRIGKDGDTDDKHYKLFRRELEIWQRLDHVNVVPFLGITYGFGLKGTMSLVSLWMPNGSLQTFLAKHDDGLGVVPRLQLLLDIANGLHYLHSMQIIHGDLDCNNVLLGVDYAARLTGFGLASLVGVIPEALSYLQSTSAQLGTVRWCPPEQVQSEEMFHKTTKSDVYSFGCVCLQVLSGKQPWSEFHEDVAVVLRLASGHKPGRPESRAMDDSHWDFIQNCWSPAEERPATEEIIRVIQRFLTRYPPSPPLLELLGPQPRRSDSLVGGGSSLSPGRASGPPGQYRLSSSSVDFPTLPDLTPYISKEDDQCFAGGVFGDVYKCRYTNGLELKEVAVKALRLKVVVDENTDSKQSKSHRRELGIWRGLEHPNVVPFLGVAYGFGTKGTMSTVSLWMPNGSLHKFLSTYDNILSVAHRLQFLLDIANGLHYLHSTPIVHGDLNCHNVLLDADYTARLVDFGLAMVVGNDPEGLSYLQRSSTRPGTLRWCAPEQIQSVERSEGTTKSDIYSFGCVCLQGGLLAVDHKPILTILQVLSGKEPWSECEEERAILLRLARGETPGRPESRPMDDTHWDFIQRCWLPMEKRPVAQVVITAIRQSLERCEPSRPVRDLLKSHPSHRNSFVDDSPPEGRVTTRWWHLVLELLRYVQRLVNRMLN